MPTPTSFKMGYMKILKTSSYFSRFQVRESSHDTAGLGVAGDAMTVASGWEAALGGTCDRLGHGVVMEASRRGPQRGSSREPQDEQQQHCAANIDATAFGAAADSWLISEVAAEQQWMALLILAPRAALEAMIAGGREMD